MSQAVTETEIDKRDDRRVHRLIPVGIGLALAFAAVALGQWLVAGAVVLVSAVAAWWAIRN